MDLELFDPRIRKGRSFVIYKTERLKWFRCCKNSQVKPSFINIFDKVSLSYAKTLSVLVKIVDTPFVIAWVSWGRGKKQNTSLFWDK